MARMTDPSRMVFFVVVLRTLAWFCDITRLLPKHLDGQVGIKCSHSESSDSAIIIDPSQFLLRNNNAVSGTVFRGEKTCIYEGRQIFQTQEKRKRKKDLDVHCKKWNVVTTIFDPSEAVRRASRVEDWCTVVVADTKTPEDYMEKLMSMNGDKGTI
eukprot:12530144-Ditylum_brightwellii.AAC.1